MKRRFNYTGRKRVNRDQITIKLKHENGAKVSFDAEILLNGVNLPDDAVAYVEAYHKTDYRRYSFGTVNNLVPLEDTDLSHLGHIENLKFRVKVVDESDEHGRILAVADRIGPTGSLQRSPILPVEFRDLGNQIWRLSFDDVDGPILEFNENIPDAHHKAKSDPELFLYVYPAVIREVLTHIIFIDGVSDINQPDPDWQKGWLNFARQFIDVEPPQLLDHEKDDFDGEEIRKWIDNAVEEFCNSHGEVWHRLINPEEGGDK
jgi:hypothetical protein